MNQEADVRFKGFLLVAVLTGVFLAVQAPDASAQSCSVVLNCCVLGPTE